MPQVLDASCGRSPPALCSVPSATPAIPRPSAASLAGVDARRTCGYSRRTEAHGPHSLAQQPLPATQRRRRKMSVTAAFPWSRVVGQVVCHQPSLRCPLLSVGCRPGQCTFRRKRGVQFTGGSGTGLQSQRSLPCLAAASRLATLVWPSRRWPGSPTAILILDST